MNPLAKKLILVLYLAISGAVFVNYLIGLRWFGPYDKLAMWGWVAFSVLGGNWLTSRAEEKAQRGEVVVEALDAEGAVHSDPKTDRFVRQMAVAVVGASVLISLWVAYRDHGHTQPMANGIALLVLVVIATWVVRTRFGSFSQVETDDGVTLTFRRRGQPTRVPWRQVESVVVSRPYSIWQVVLKFRCPGESGTQTVRFLPLGWRKMTPAVAEKLQSALDERRMSQ